MKMVILRKDNNIYIICGRSQENLLRTTGQSILHHSWFLYEDIFTRDFYSKLWEICHGKKVIQNSIACFHNEVNKEIFIN